MPSLVRTKVKSPQLSTPNEPPEASETNRLSRTDWEGILDQWESSNLSQKKFCKQQGLNINTFTYHRTQRLHAAESNKKLIPIKVTSAASSSASHQLGFVLQLVCGAKLIIPNDYNQATLQGLLTLLGVCSC